MRRGTTVTAVSDSFAASVEFVTMYGSVGNSAFVDLVYQNVLGRTADSSGKRYWLDQLATGALTRGGLMLSFAQSPEYVAKTASEVNVVMTFVGMLRRSPDAGGYAYWVDQLDNRGGSILSLIGGCEFSAEYAARVAP